MTPAPVWSGSASDQSIDFTHNSRIGLVQLVEETTTSTTMAAPLGYGRRNLADVRFHGGATRWSSTVGENEWQLTKRREPRCSAAHQAREEDGDAAREVDRRRIRVR